MGRSSLFFVLGAVAMLSACEATAVVGGACMYPSDCQQPLVCRFGRCRAQCTANRDCPIGASCLLDARGRGACGVDQDLGCSGVVGCDDALSCVGDRCVRRCADADDCPDDGVCAVATGTTRACFDGREPVPDASVLDASLPEADAR